MHGVDPRVLERGAHEAGRIPVERLERRVDEHDAEAEAAVHERGRLRVVHACGPHRPMSCAVWAIRSSATMRMPCVAARAAEALDVGLADQRLLDEDADLGVPALGDQVRPEDRLVGHRALREREGPLAQPVVGAGDADRRNVEALLDRLARRDGVVGDARAEDGEAALVDELAVGVDHRLDRSLRKSLDLAEHDLAPAGR